MSVSTDKHAKRRHRKATTDADPGARTSNTDGDAERPPVWVPTRYPIATSSVSDVPNPVRHRENNGNNGTRWLGTAAVSNASFT